MLPWGAWEQPGGVPGVSKCCPEVSGSQHLPQGSGCLGIRVPWESQGYQGAVPGILASPRGSCGCLGAAPGVLAPPRRFRGAWVPLWQVSEVPGCCPGLKRRGRGGTTPWGAGRGPGGGGVPHLQVPVDDELLVAVLHGRHYLQERGVSAGPPHPGRGPQTPLGVGGVGG